MASKNIIQSAEIATETGVNGYGSIDPATGIPTTVGLTFHSAEFADKAQILQPGDPVMAARNGGRVGPYELPDEAPFSVLRRGTFTLTLPWRTQGDGTVYASHDNMPLWKLIRTMMPVSQPGTLGTDAVSAAGTTTSHTATSAAKFLIGQIFRAIKNGRSDYSAVTNIAGAVLTYSPAMSVALANADLAYSCVQAYVHNGAVPTMDSCCVRFNGDGWTATCYGCKASSIEFQYSAETGRMDLAFTLDTAAVVYSTGGTVVPPGYSDGGVLHHLMSYCKISTTGGTSLTPIASPAALAVATPCLDAFTLKLDAMLSEQGCGESSIHRAGMETVGYSLTGSLTLSGVDATYAADYTGGVQRSVLIGFGGAAAPGQGGCIYIPAAVLGPDPAKHDTGKEHLRTTLSIKGMGYWNGDAGAVVPADSLFRVAMGLDY